MGSENIGISTVSLTMCVAIELRDLIDGLPVKIVPGRSRFGR
jgi:hypothetical protein